MDGRKLELKEQQLLNRSNFYLVIFLLFPLLVSFDLKKSDREDRVCLYLIKPNSRYKLARTVDNLKDNFVCYIEQLDNETPQMFHSYTDCAMKLKEQQVTEHSNNLCIACAEICFNKKVVRVFFSRNGDYYFEGQWYVRNNGFFYNLFCHVSSEYVPIEILESSRNCRIDRFWKTNDFINCE